MVLPVPPASVRPPLQPPQRTPRVRFWQDARGTPAAVSSGGARAAVKAARVRAVTLDKLSLAGLLQAAPAERSAAARQSPLVMVLPDPAGGFQRFAVVDSPVMEAGLAARHPEIKTYAGRGIDDPSATLRMSVTPLGVQASVRSSSGAWYVDPYYEREQGLYASYYRADMQRSVSNFSEGLMRQAQATLSRGRYHAGNEVKVEGLGFIPNGTVTITVRQAGQAIARQTVYASASEDGTLVASFKADPYRALGSYEVTLSDGRSTTSSVYEVVPDNSPLLASTGSVLRTYRLALLTDPAYANFFGGSANVTAAKVALVNRVNQVYEDDLSVRMVLVANNDVLNLDTAAQFSGANGPCGGTACYSTASVSCSSATLTRTRTVIGLLVGASNFDIGHIAVGAGGGGIASLGVVGLAAKAQGCTGLPSPNGDVFAVDYVAHEMGHQFAGNHTFNGVTGSCSGGNRSAGQLGRAWQRHLGDGLRRHLRHRQHAEQQRPVFLDAQLRRNHHAHRCCRAEPHRSAAGRADGLRHQRPAVRAALQRRRFGAHRARHQLHHRGHPGGHPGHPRLAGGWHGVHQRAHRHRLHHRLRWRAGRRGRGQPATGGLHGLHGLCR